MIQISGNSLTLAEIDRVARHNEGVVLSDSANFQLRTSYNNLIAILDSNSPVYGINTGFGIFSDKRIPNEDAARLSRNLIISHAVGVGPALDSEVVRSAILIRANALAKGFSGVRPLIVETLLRLLNENLVPVIPSQGSMGSSGDLSCLSHLALVFTTDAQNLERESGQAYYEKELLSGKVAMERAGIERLILGPKEGLAINNGATFSTAIASLAVYDAYYLLGVANIALAMTLEALLGCYNAYDPRIHEVRQHSGQKIIASCIRNLIQGSTFVNASGRVQDAYSLRCAPHVHGAIYEATDFSANVTSAEINAATDNPLIFNERDVLSGGNFHGEAIGMAMDFLGIALTEMSSISERRTYRMLDGNLNHGLPAMLVDNSLAAGLNSGLMMPQYTAASLTLENQTLATPDSIRSLPTSAGQEDHNANAMTAARHCRQILENVKYVISIELFTALRAIDLRKRQMPGIKLGEGTQKYYNLLRDKVPYQAGDAYWTPDITIIKQMIDGKIIPMGDYWHFNGGA
jgi:histidine ammonia-lyase